ncbi:substrate-binding periplasmic protein [Chromobacterium sphagni]|uniref:Solute-binding protein family 3/N-terminal domain-containing protein n=1 Tax=Chromobacterium sphagni TaxID=1903179 RepID=A0ABX3CC94_9NEIS|nr:transporter substrate-binding domain-containing protein [Chromobacterium sphagni]OHX19622.1 hypothetical protein BI344_17715 [Chromobacterium sphagni]
MPQLHRFLLLLALSLPTAPACAAAASESIRLSTHLQPPLSFVRTNGIPDGLAVQVVDCALKRMQRSYALEFLPWPRAQWQVQHGQADGFFAATPSTERDGYAVLSASLLSYQRRWYLLKDAPLSPADPGFKQQARIGAFSGSNMDGWLKSHGYRLTAMPTSSEQLLRMLLNHHVDAILGNAYAVDSLIASMGLQAELRSELLESLPLGVYFGKAFLAREGPQFLPQFNSAVESCRAK